MADPVDRRRVSVRRFAPDGGSLGQASDAVIVEEPLEIVVDDDALMVTMRTPGHDAQLALGFCYSEGLIASPADVEGVGPVDETAPLQERSARSSNLEGGSVRVRLTEAGRERLGHTKRIARLFPASSACGVCGRPSLDDLWQRIPLIRPLGLSSSELSALITTLLEPLRERQTSFSATGGCHAAAIFDLEGSCLAAFEDVGRHNAVDKLVGYFFERTELPLAERILVTSGRAGFEIVQKAAAAGVPVVASIGAASSLAIEMAEFAGVTLLSFVAGDSINLHDTIQS